MRFFSIRNKLRWIALTPVVCLALLYGLFYDQQYHLNLKQQMLRLGKAYISQMLSLEQFHPEPAALQNILNTIHLNSEVNVVAFYDAQGHLMASHGAHPFQALHQAQRQIGQEPHQTKYAIQFIVPIPPTYCANLAMNAEPGNPGIHDIRGWLFLELDKKFLLIKHYQMILSTLGIVLLCLIFGYIGHYLLSKNIAEPLMRLRRNMQRILHNDYEVVFEKTRTDELGIIEQGCAHLQENYKNLSQDFNQQIEIATQDLQQSLELLEVKNIELSLEKKKVEEKNRNKSEFLASMSHEIRTPMNGVIGFTNVLLDTPLNNLQLDYVKTIQSSSQDLLTIINDILDYSKMDAGKLHLDHLPLNLRGCIDEVIAMIAPTAYQKNIDLIPITDINVPKTVMGDPWRIKQILSNLVSNAVKFTDAGHVLIRTQIEKVTDKHYHFAFSITDTGIGISKEDQLTLFHPFQQVDTTPTRRHGGSGLGLVICKKLVEHMQGALSILSESHQGTTFTVRLKLEKLMSYEAEKHQPQGFLPFKALCFDENPLHLEAICAGLHYLGAECTPISSFAQLRTLFSSKITYKIAFIACDAKTENIIAQFMQDQKITWILVTKSYTKHYEKLGAKALLFKPPNIHKLNEVLEALIDPNRTVTHTLLEPAFMVDHTPNSWLEQRHALPQGSGQDPQLQHLRQLFQEKNARLLIAEDNPVSRRLLNSLLSPSATIDLVNDGAEAVQACQSIRYSALLLDLHMPNLNGLDAASIIRKSSTCNAQTPIILISANGKDLQQTDLHAAGINFSIQKPIEEHVLLRHLLQLVTTKKPSVIDWNLCVEKLSGNVALATDFLAEFVKELHKNRLELMSIFEANDCKALEKIIHQIHGACCFCGVSALQKQIAHVEQRLRKAKSVAEIQEDFLRLIEEMEAVIAEYADSYQT